MSFTPNQRRSPNPQTYSYVRVSQLSQDLQKDKLSILELANELKLGTVNFCEETVSGKISWKQRKICALVDILEEGDSLLITEISRLGRSLLKIVEILSICSRKGINVYSVKNAWRLDSSLQSKVVGTVLALCAEVERSLISQRTKEALRIKKLNGVRLGRPPGIGKSKLDQYAVEIQALIANGSTQAFIANRYHTSAVNLCLWLKKHNIQKSTTLNTI